MNNLQPGVSLSDIPGNESVQPCGICCKAQGGPYIDLYGFWRYWCRACQQVATAEQIGEIHAALHKLYEQDGIVREYHATYEVGVMYHQTVLDDGWTTLTLPWARFFKLIDTSFPEES